MPIERKRQYYMKKAAKKIICRKMFASEMSNYLEQKEDLFRADDESFNKVRRQVQSTIKDFIELDPEYQDEEE